ncbi:SulP family inorganic anion transporter [Sediminibacterium ginsengisoli]|uniref:Sulfate permease, MFS superfamily n=1 Tax=Sediminibacterium ginsengisoli TaxID=413434 RepID=A0A1T4ML45_9BACT|nr:SulP family inorganic anion transporter [Sediminibacterium ginsengisoli]SJZ67468.1 Sulfate permease, MFS superfamily [Sediminibacterium ginsengisoli]
MKKFFKHAGADVSASIVVLLVALPLCLGIALGSGAPLFSGIIAGVVGGIVIGIASGSQLSVSGPAAGLTVIVAAAILKLQVYEAFLLAVVLAGVLQVIFGFMKAGVIGDFVPNSVIKGMLAAIGLILIMKQFPHLIGYDKDFEGDEAFAQSNNENTFSALFSAVRFITPTALIIGGISLLLLMLWETEKIKRIKALKLVPGPLVVVLAGTLINEYLRGSGAASALETKHLVTLPVAENISSFFSFFTFPDVSFLKNPDVWTSAITLAIVASLETLLGIEAADKLDPLKRVTPTNRELKAQGLGNIVSGMIGGLPLTSVVVRTSANISSGAKSKMSTILHGLFLLLCVMLVPTLLNKIPLSALAAVLIFTGYKLAKVSLFKAFYKKGWDQFIPFVVTIAAILLTDLLVGILIGLGVGLFFMIRSNFRSSVFVVNDNNNYLIRFRKDVSFLNKAIVKRKLEDVPGNASVIIDATRADFIDKDIIEEVNNFLCHAHLKKIRVEVKKSQNKSMHTLFNEPQNLS